ncbi:hypothetical protein DFH06DRAFT_1128616 [Mycena polygramma]|nr:hypothetical protein DFH06DRAFT_1128616 [Mycena polygramma]
MAKVLDQQSGHAVGGSPITITHRYLSRILVFAASKQPTVQKKEKHDMDLTPSPDPYDVPVRCLIGPLILLAAAVTSITIEQRHGCKNDLRSNDRTKRQETERRSETMVKEAKAVYFARNTFCGQKYVLFSKQGQSSAVMCNRKRSGHKAVLVIGIKWRPRHVLAIKVVLTLGVRFRAATRGTAGGTGRLEFCGRNPGTAPLVADLRSLLGHGSSETAEGKMPSKWYWDDDDYSIAYSGKIGRETLLPKKRLPRHKLWSNGAARTSTERARRGTDPEAQEAKYIRKTRAHTRETHMVKKKMETHWTHSEETVFIHQTTSPPNTTIAIIDAQSKTIEAGEKKGKKSGAMIAITDAQSKTIEAGEKKGKKSGAYDRKQMEIGAITLCKTQVITSTCVLDVSRRFSGQLRNRNVHPSVSDPNTVAIVAVKNYVQCPSKILAERKKKALVDTTDFLSAGIIYKALAYWWQLDGYSGQIYCHAVGSCSPHNARSPAIDLELDKVRRISVRRSKCSLVTPSDWQMDTTATIASNQYLGLSKSIPLPRVPALIIYPHTVDNSDFWVMKAALSLSHTRPPPLVWLHRSKRSGLLRMFRTLSPTIVHRRGLACPKADNSGVPLADAPTTLGDNLFGCQYNTPNTTLACFYSDADGTLKIGTSGCPPRLGASEAPTTTKQSNPTATTKSAVPSQSGVLSSTAAPSSADTTSSSPDPPHNTSSPGGSPLTTPAPTSAGLTSSIPSSQGVFTAAASPRSHTSRRQKFTLSPGSIAGIACGIVALLIIIISITLLTQRTRRLKPVFQPELLQGRYVYSSKMPIPRDTAAEKSSPAISRTRQPSTESRPLPVAAAHRQNVITERIIAVQSELATLASVGDDDEDDTLRRRIEILEERNRILESELRSQWAQGLSDEPPPGYSHYL